MRNEEFNDSHSPSVINYNDEDKEDEMDRACSVRRGKEECMKDFDGKARRKRPPGRPRRR
jgi:hypothetical protein